MTYLPLARKYRPQTFADLVGQAHITSTLTRALEQKRVGQAYLFTGQRGVGKTSAARILAKCLNCEQGPTPTPCQTCASCAQITQGNSLDVIEIDGASNRGIDEIRSLRETVPFAPTSGPFRIYIIDEVHMLTLEAFNALLKTLEEPPAHIKFIFATTAAAKVPATILSRCQRFDFRRLEAATIVAVLQRLAKAERLAVEEPALYAMARAADGSLRDAEVILEQATSFVDGPVGEAHVAELLGSVESEALSAWAEAILDRDAPKALELLMAQLSRGRSAPQLLTSLLRQFRNLLILRSTQPVGGSGTPTHALIDEPPERLAQLAAQAGRASAQEFLLALQMLAGAYELIRRSPMAQTILELVVLKLCTREPWQSLEQISQRLEQLGAGPHAPAPSPTPGGAPSGPLRSQPVASPQPSSQAADAPQADEPSAAPMATAPESLRGAWPTFLERLGAQKMSLAAYLAESKPLQVEGALLTVGLPAFALHQEVLSTTENRRLIERLLHELYHEPLTVRYVTLPEPSAASPAGPAPAAAPPVPPIVQEIVQLFNATVDRPRPIT